MKKLVLIGDDEMIIYRYEYMNLLKENSDLREKASPFYKYTPNQIRLYCGLPPVKKYSKKCKNYFS